MYKFKSPAASPAADKLELYKVYVPGRSQDAAPLGTFPRAAPCGPHDPSGQSPCSSPVSTIFVALISVRTPDRHHSDQPP